MIELGRYQIDNVTRENRLCPLCKCKQTKDKIYFLVPDIERKPTTEIIKFLINSNDYFKNKLVQ